MELLFIFLLFGIIRSKFRCFIGTSIKTGNLRWETNISTSLISSPRQWSSVQPRPIPSPNLPITAGKLCWLSFIRFRSGEPTPVTPVLPFLPTDVTESGLARKWRHSEGGAAAGGGGRTAACLAQKKMLVYEWLAKQLCVFILSLLLVIDVFVWRRCLMVLVVVVVMV